MSDDPFTVRLTWPEVVLAAHAGVMRQVAALKDGRADSHGFEGPGWDQHILGALGEMAFCKAFGVYWTPTVNTFKAADIGTTIEIKTRSRDDYELLVRPDDKFERIFVLITGVPPVLTVRGWKRGTDCQRDEWWKDYGKRPHAWFVPQAALLPPQSLGVNGAVAAQRLIVRINSDNPALVIGAISNILR